MIPGVRENSVLSRNHYTSLRIAVDNQQVMVIEIGILPMVQTALRVFRRMG